VKNSHKFILRHNSLADVHCDIEQAIHEATKRGTVASRCLAIFRFVDHVYLDWHINFLWFNFACWGFNKPAYGYLGERPTLQVERSASWLVNYSRMEF